MSTLQGEPGLPMVELLDFVLFRPVAIPAVPVGKLPSVGIVVLVTCKTEAGPPGRLQAEVVEFV